MVLIGRRVPESIQAAEADIESAVVVRRTSLVAPFISTHHPFGFGMDKPDVRPVGRCIHAANAGV